MAVVGAGSWGTTVAALASANTPTQLWARRAELVEQMGSARVNPDYLPKVKFGGRTAVIAFRNIRSEISW